MGKVLVVCSGVLGPQGLAQALQDTAVSVLQCHYRKPLVLGWKSQRSGRAWPSQRDSSYCMSLLGGPSPGLQVLDQACLSHCVSNIAVALLRSSGSPADGQGKQVTANAFRSQQLLCCNSSIVVSLRDTTVAQVEGLRILPKVPSASQSQWQLYHCITAGWPGPGGFWTVRAYCSPDSGRCGSALWPKGQLCSDHRWGQLIHLLQAKAGRCLY